LLWEVLRTAALATRYEEERIRVNRG